MTFEDAMKRLAGCRALQPDELQVIVAADIVDALLASSEPEPNAECPDCGGELHAVEDRYAHGDGHWLHCEDCSYEVALHGCGCADCPVAMRLRAELRATSSRSQDGSSFSLDSTAQSGPPKVRDRFGIAPACDACGADAGTLCRRRIGYCPRTVS